MKLARLRIQNFRCFRDEISFDFDDMTALIGKNDVGKSTVMDALDIFLNDKTPDKDDASKTGDGKNLAITCEFVDLPSKIVLDEEYPTSFQEEYLLNQESRLVLRKTYSGHTASPKCVDISVLAFHPTAESVGDLLRLTNAELKKRAKELKTDLTDVDQKINAHLRQSIRACAGDLKCQTIAVPLTDGNAKKVWEGIKARIPVFAVFKADREITDQDPEAQDPLRIAVKEAIKQKETQLGELTAYVESEVRKIADVTLAKLKEMDASLAQQLKPQIEVKKWDTLFSVKITDEENIPINKRGSGVRRLVLLNFFRAKAEQQATARNDAPVIYAVEEPETSQHPHNQRLLLNALTDLTVDNQVIITTHTPMLLRSLPDKCLRYIRQKDDKSREVLCGGGDTNELLRRSLGVLPDNAVKLFVGVEGKHDITFLKNISTVLRRNGADVLDLEKMELDGELIFFPLGGESLVLWTSRLVSLNRPELHLYDRDFAPPEIAQYQTAADKINQRDRCKALITGKKEMENYLHFEAVNEAYQENNIVLGLTDPFDDFTDVPAMIAERVHSVSGSDNAWADLELADKKKKISQAKSMLNRVATLRMTKIRVDEVDPDGHIVEWFQQMKNLSEMQ